MQLVHYDKMINSLCTFWSLFFVKFKLYIKYDLFLALVNKYVIKILNTIYVIIRILIAAGEHKKLLIHTRLG